MLRKGVPVADQQERKPGSAVTVAVELAKGPGKLLGLGRHLSPGDSNDQR